MGPNVRIYIYIYVYIHIPIYIYVEGTFMYYVRLDLGLSGGWASFCRLAALSLSPIERTLFLSKREMQLAVSKKGNRDEERGSSFSI